MHLRLLLPVRTIRALTVLLGLCVLAVPVAAVAKAEKTVKLKKENKRADSRTIESLEENWRQALLNADSGALEKLLSDDFFAISANGTLSDKEQYLRRLGTRENAFSLIDLMDVKMRLQPRSAIVISQARVKGQLNGRPIEGIFRYTKVYGRSSTGQWHVLNFEATRVSSERIDDSDMHRGMPLVDARRGR